MPDPRTREDRLTAVVALADLSMPRLAATSVATLQAAYELHAAPLLDVSWSSFESVVRAAQMSPTR